LIITRASNRISLIGGSTDFLVPAKLWSGLTVGFSIDKYSYISVRWRPKLFGTKSKISYSEIEEVDSNKDIKHSFVRKVLDFYNVTDGIEINHMSDLPAGLGTGSSSSFMAALVLALAELHDEELTKNDLMERCIRIEQDCENIGQQDIVYAIYPCLRQVEFRSGNGKPVTKMIGNMRVMKNLEKSLLVLYTGSSRRSSEVVSSFIGKLHTDENKDNHLKLVELARQGVEALENDDIPRLGELLHENWMIKKQLSDKISNAAVDEIYEKGCKAGAIGGKLCGSGSSGLFIFIVEPEKRSSVRAALSELAEVPVKISSCGCEVIFRSDS